MGRVTALFDGQPISTTAEQADNQFPEFRASFARYAGLLHSAGLQSSAVLDGRVKGVTFYNSQELGAFFDDFGGSDRVREIRQLYGFSRTLEHCHVHSQAGRNRRTVDTLVQVMETIVGKNGRLTKLLAETEVFAQEHVRNFRELAFRHPSDHFALQSYLDNLSAAGTSPFLLDRWLESVFPGVRMMQDKSVAFDTFLSGLRRDIDNNYYDKFVSVKDIVFPRNFDIIPFTVQEKPPTVEGCVAKYDELFPHSASFQGYISLLTHAGFPVDELYDGLPNPHDRLGVGNIFRALFSFPEGTEDITKLRHIYGMARLLPESGWVEALSGGELSTVYQAARRQANERVEMYMRMAEQCQRDELFPFHRYAENIHALDDAEADFALHRWMELNLASTAGSGSRGQMFYEVSAEARYRDVMVGDFSNFNGLEEFVDPFSVL